MVIRYNFLLYTLGTTIGQLRVQGILLLRKKRQSKKSTFLLIVQLLINSESDQWQENTNAMQI
ncbi:hypothetical protein [Nitrosomonas marina]|uniref:hypothetical protein n=1 Tax=Nitrosomonas marina TaxID=917 RepID=UPI000B87C625|nr:hypothetical protein [Nitrosomonas marina]